MGRGTSRFEYRYSKIAMNNPFSRLKEANENILTMHYHN